MRYLFRTDYKQDTALARHGGDRFWYGLLLVLMLAIPYLLGEFYVGELGGVFIFAIAGVGLLLLVGYTLLVVSLLVFGITQVLPADAAVTLLGENATPAAG